MFTNIAKKLIDCRSFRTCCRTLKSVIPLPPPPYPWFFYFKHYKGNLNFQDLMYGHTHEKQVDDSLSTAEVVFSKKCWLVMTMMKRMANPELDPDLPVRLHITFYNPFTKEARTVPEMVPYPCSPSSFGISAPPTSPDCCVIAMWEDLLKEVVFSFMRLEDQCWHFFLRPHDQHEFQPSYHNTPVFLDDKFYFLDKARRLGVFSYGRGYGSEFTWTWDVYDWKLLDKVGEQAEHLRDEPGLELEYLVECGGEILAVLVTDFGEFVRVYKFDQEHEGWLEVEDLGSHMLFVSRTSCFSRVEEVDGTGNKIYFSRVSTKQQSVMFYSLDTRKYQTFNSKDHAMEDFQPTSEVCLSGWIETALR
ncbi:unnamed protein product [Linum trigynum]|uniref:KIB1-4 beta-propeller domain-containing protein n=1 Tax=Linum trigynum TaxID=586398 RepID=A0AAV2GJN4_9ROSI